MDTGTENKTNFNEKNLSAQCSIPTANNYELLNESVSAAQSESTTPQDVNDDDMDTISVISADSSCTLANKAKPDKSNRKQKPFVTYSLNEKLFAMEFQKSTGHTNLKFNSLNRNCTLVFTFSLADYMTAKEMLIKLNIAFYSYTPDELNPTNVVIRGIPLASDEQDVKDALNTINNVKVDLLILYKPKPFDPDHPNRLNER